MSRHGDPASALVPNDAVPAGLVAKLTSAVRPEFRVDVFHVEPSDPVFGGSPCQVPECPQVAGLYGLCTGHRRGWYDQGRPDIEGFVNACGDLPPDREHLDLGPVEAHLRLEMQYVLQRRHDEGQRRMAPALLRRVVAVLVRSGMPSLLAWPEETWRERVTTAAGATAAAARPFLTYARRQLETLHQGSGWDVEYPRTTWRLRNLGITDGDQATISFEAIPQPWLADLAKRWTRWRLSCGLSTNQAGRGVTALAQFAQFLARPDVGVDALGNLDRSVLERYLADLHVGGGGTERRRRFLGLLGTFLSDIRRHRWDTSLPTDAVLFTEDIPRKAELLPRAVAEHVMAQVEDPANLNRWHNPAHQLITLILIRCGLRVSDAVKLPFDCVVTDADAAPYLPTTTTR